MQDSQKDLTKAVIFEFLQKIPRPTKTVKTKYSL